jgi:hypothetical protein
MCELHQSGNHRATGCSQSGVEAQVVKVTDCAEFAHYGLLATPGLVVNEKLVCGGHS